MNKKELFSEKYLVYAFLLIYIITNIVFGLSEEATWDDDCPNRYFNTLNAFENPKQFISIWNRPLFVIVFAPIVHLGRNSIFITMVLLTAIGAYFLYKGLQKKGTQNAYLILPFLLFQTYFFSISRNAETEPMAVALICLGFYFLVHKKWLGFVIVGGLLPLARLELSVLLIFWGWYLLKEKQYKYIPLFLFPLFLWNFAGYLIEGDWRYLYNATIGQENKTNRYGHTSFGHYFQRYIYVVGPIIYLFFIVGVVSRIKQLKFDFFVFLQFVSGFSLYVLFSWKLNIGNAAGFLRNLIPLSPFVAILALDGYNYLHQLSIGFFGLKNKALVLSQVPFVDLSEVEYNELSSKKRKVYKKEKSEYLENLKKEKTLFNFKKRKEKKSLYWSLVIVGLSVLFIGFTVFVFHSFEIKSHHVLTKKVDYTNLIWLGALLLILVSFVLLLRNKLNILKISLGVSIGLLALLFTGYTEPPDFNMSSERYVMKGVSKWFVNSGASSDSVYVNHHWFFWSGDLNRNKGFKEVTIANIKKAKEGELCIYDTHYSHRLNGDVPKKWFENRIDWVELDRYISDNNSFHCVVYQKTDSTISGCSKMLNAYIEKNENKPLSYFSRGNLNTASKQIDKAIEDYTKAIELDSTKSFFYENRGKSFFVKNKFNKSINDFKKTFELNNRSHDALHNIGICFTKMSKLDSALVYFNKAIELKPDFINALTNKSNALKHLKRKDEALVFYTQYIKKNINTNVFLLERAQLYYNDKAYLNCINDLDKALKINNKNPQAIFVRGVCYQNLGKKVEACKDYSLAVSLGHKQAKQFVQLYCNTVK